MNEKSIGNIHWSFWVIGVIALVWNLMGVANFISQMSPEMVATFPESHQSIIKGRPIWATGAFAVAVFGGVIGCILLLLKKIISLYLFVASLLGVLIAHIYTLSILGQVSGFNAFEIALMILLTPLIAAFLIWYAKFGEKRGWVH